VTILKHTHNFLNWWLTGLLYLLPIDLREKIRHTSDRLLVELDEDSINLRLYHGASNELLQTRSLQKDDKLEFIALQEWLDGLRTNDTEFILLAPMNKILFKSLTLPASAKDNVREILGFEMDRQTPFTVEQVYFDYLQLDSTTNNEKLQLELFVATKNVIDELLSILKDWQIQAQRITIMRDEKLLGQINFLSEQLQAPAIKNANKFTQVLASCCLLLFIAALYLPLSSQEQSLVTLEAQVNKSRVQAKELLALTTEKENILSRSRFLVEKRSGRISTIEIVNELTRILPDDTWLNRLVIRDDKIELQGESNTATAIIQIVENSIYFRDVQFRSPVTHNNATNKDKFNVSAQMDKGGAT
jgi:general secretion pathway protein L